MDVKLQPTNQLTSVKGGYVSVVLSLSVC